MFPLPPLRPEQRALVQQVTALSRERFAPRAARYDAESVFPTENYEDLRVAGLLGLTVPKEHGGLGADPLTYALCLLEIAKGCSSTALTFNMHATIITFIAAIGTEEQKQRYFDEVVKNGRLIASITSEPESSFRDKFVIQTVFRPVNGGYHVSGLKHFCSLGDSADYYFVSGILEGSASAREGLLSALIRRTDPGIKVEGIWNATGMRGTISHTIRYDSFVDRSDIIGAPAQLLTIDLSGFALGYAATYLGIGEAAFDFIVEYAKTKTFKPSTEPLSHHPLTQRTIAEMGTAIRAARGLLCEAALVKMEGDKEATMLAVNQAKYFGAEVGAMVTERAIRLAGGRGILKDLPLERWHRDSLAGPVMPPSNDRCLETIGKVLCGLKAATLEFQ
ncbi:MAG: acyl-CoA/acyl-ACP dehydrogenase [Candidatus Rokubacteria bacterium]|nr:acyl-CoA/acyl-ACP dehydrogenase [Candidatus Rokubacteria bacterium]